ncbi:MAG TPA: methylisocitrate lyase [Parachlamydiaceae bacterium]|nr:methylisocitrate lyase [Parachlamydiaceae bacterium]
MKESPGFCFRKAVMEEKPLQVVGTINAYAAIMAENCGFRAIYLSGAGVSNACFGVPDVGLTTLDNVVEEARRITDAVDLPLLVDIDTGWGNAMMIARTIRAMEKSGVAAVHMEDQPTEKQCGHLPNKSLVSSHQMVERLKAAVDARKDPSFTIMARTDAYADEGIEKTIERCLAYEEAGADMHFIEALTTLDEYRQFSEALRRPILANITEFGKTPLFTKEELARVGVSLVLYPLSAWRAMNLAALKVYHGIRAEGTQKHLLNEMQTREELYGFLNYEIGLNARHNNKG